MQKIKLFVIKCIDSIYLYAKANKLFLLFLIIAYLYKNTIDNFVYTYFFDPVINKIQFQEFDVKIIISFLLIILFLYICKLVKRKYFVSHHVCVNFLILVILYVCLYRNSSVWQFEYIIGVVNYVDFFLFPFVCLCFSNLVRCIKNRICKSKDAHKCQLSPFITDQPIAKDNSLDGDILERNSYASHIIKKLEKTKNLDSAFAVGIYSEWGSGKTSMLNLMRREIEQNCDNIVVDFKPWNSMGKEGLLKNFFETLKSELSKHCYGISSLIDKYMNLLLAVSDSKLVKVARVMSDINNNANLSKQFDRINKKIKDSGKRLYIIIDDLDRLYKDEITQVFKLIRESASFKETVFLVAYDREYVVKALADINCYEPDKYLEKIFQIDVDLPRIDKGVFFHVLKNELSGKLQKEYNEIEELLQYDENHSYSIDLSIFDVVNSLRDLKRFINSFMLIYDLVKTYVCVKDLFVLELIRFSNKKLYSYIVNESKLLFNKEKIDDDLYWIKLNFDASLYNDNTNNFDLFENLDDNLKNTLGLTEIECNLLIYLFPPVKPNGYSFRKYYEKGYKSLNNSFSHSLYSYYRLLENKISDVEFGELKTLKEEELNCKMNVLYESGKINDLINKLKIDQEVKDFNDFQSLVKIMFFVKRNYNWQLNPIPLYYILNQIVEKNSRKIEKDQFESVLINNFENAKFPYVNDLDVLNSIIKQANKFDKSKFEKIRENIVIAYIEEFTEFKQEVFEVLTRSNTINGVEDLIWTKVNQYFKDKVKERICNDVMKSFLECIIIKEEEKYKINSSYVQTFFQNIHEMMDVLKLKEGAYVNEFCKFYNLIKQRSASVEFDFKHLKVKNI
jgi:hypothetical protein